MMMVIFINKKQWQQSKCPLTEWLKNMGYLCVCMYVCVCIYIYMNITQPQKNVIMPFAATWMNSEIIILTEVREKNIIYYQ